METEKDKYKDNSDNRIEKSEISSDRKHFENNLTNDEKLEYLKQLVREVDEKVEASGLNKKLVR